jgi:hypothetical protein
LLTLFIKVHIKRLFLIKVIESFHSRKMLNKWYYNDLNNLTTENHALPIFSLRQQNSFWLIAPPPKKKMKMASLPPDNHLCSMLCFKCLLC